ncbi:MAG: surface carbohydrate biosynthesis protein [Chthonomonadales bacterium]
MNKRRFLIVVPYKARDLEGHALVAYYLERLFGHEVVCTNGYAIPKKLLRWAPDVLVLDHLNWDFKRAEAAEAHRMGMRVAVLPTEGLFLNDRAVEQQAQVVAAASQHVDLYLCWGDRLRAALMRVAGMSGSQAVTVGCVRNDFFADPFLATSSTREQFAAQWKLDPDKPIILWATNTTYYARDPRKIIRRYVRKGGLTEDEVRSFLDAEVQQFEHGWRVVEELARRHPEWNLLIKIHPAEQPRPYVHRARRAPNIRIALNAPIRDFLLHSDVLLQRNCTTATEAWMFGKPVLQLEIGDYAFQPEALYRDGCHMVYSTDEACNAVEAYVEGVPISPQQKRARDEFLAATYYRVDGGSGLRIAQALHRLVSAPAYTDEDRARVQDTVRRAYAEWKRREDARAVNRVKDLLHISREVSLRWWKKLPQRDTWGKWGGYVAEPEITREMVEELYARYAEVVPIAQAQHWMAAAGGQEPKDA